MPSILGDWLLLSGYLVIASFFIIQLKLRQTKAARSFNGGEYDRGNTTLIGAVTGLGLCLPLVADFLGFAAFNINLAEGLFALAVMALGVGLRVWAAVVLGKFYTTTLMTTEGQTIVTSGPYALVRHPGYLGEILLWAGFAVLSSNTALLVIIPLMFLAAYMYRIAAEEGMLVKELGESYVRYRKRTHKLVPFLY